MVSRSIFANKSRFPNESGFLNESRFNESLPNKSRFKSRYSELIPNESRFSFSKVSRFPNVSRFQRDFQNETRSEKDSLFETSLVFPNVSQTCLVFWASHVFMAYRVPIISRRFLSSPISLVYQKPWEIPIKYIISRCDQHDIVTFRFAIAFANCASPPARLGRSKNNTWFFLRSSWQKHVTQEETIHMLQLLFKGLN